MPLTHIGNFEVHRIAEYEGPFIAPDTFFPDFDAEAVRSNPDHPGSRLIDRATGNLLFSFHSFIVCTAIERDNFSKRFKLLIISQSLIHILAGDLVDSLDDSLGCNR